MLLSVDGYEVRTAASAEEALTVLESFPPRLILMDCNSLTSMGWS